MSCGRNMEKAAPREERRLFDSPAQVQTKTLLVIPAAVAVVIAPTLLNNNPAHHLASVVIVVLDADRMAAAQIALIEPAATMIDEPHVSAMIEAHRPRADPEADEVRAVALVNAIVMICKSCSRQDGGDCSEDNN